MKYLIKKSIAVIIINVFTAVFIVIALSSFTYTLNMSYEYQDGLTQNYILFSFNKINDNIFVGDLLDEVKKCDEQISVFRYQNNGTCGVYYNSEVRAFLQMQSGRFFIKDDFDSNDKVAVVSNVYSNQCVIVDNEKKILIDNDYYRVIGEYEYNYNPVNESAYVYYNLNTLENRSETTYIGQFALDADNNTDSIVSNLKNDYPISIIKTVNQFSWLERFKTALSSQFITLVPLTLVTIMVLLNSVNISINWIEKRKKELVARQICGATYKNIGIMLFNDYYMIITASFLVGAIIAFFISKVPIKLFVGFVFSISAIAVSYIVTVVVSLLSISIVLVRSYRKTIVSQRGV